MRTLQHLQHSHTSPMCLEKWLKLSKYVHQIVSALPLGKSARDIRIPVDIYSSKTIHISVTNRGCCEDIVITLTGCYAKAFFFFFFLTLVQSHPKDCKIYSMTDFPSKPLCSFL